MGRGEGRGGLRAFVVIYTAILPRLSSLTTFQRPESHPSSSSPCLALSHLLSPHPSDPRFSLLILPPLDPRPCFPPPFTAIIHHRYPGGNILRINRYSYPVLRSRPSCSSA